jgi:hypothetical protein
METGLIIAIAGVAAADRPSSQRCTHLYVHAYIRGPVSPNICAAAGPRVAQSGDTNGIDHSSHCVCLLWKFIVRYILLVCPFNCLFEPVWDESAVPKRRRVSGVRVCVYFCCLAGQKTGLGCIKTSTSRACDVMKTLCSPTLPGENGMPDCVCPMMTIDSNWIKLLYIINNAYTCSLCICMYNYTAVLSPLNATDKNYENECFRGLWGCILAIFLYQN